MALAKSNIEQIIVSFLAVIFLIVSISCVSFEKKLVDTHGKKAATAYKLDLDPSDKDGKDLAFTFLAAISIFLLAFPKQACRAVFSEVYLLRVIRKLYILFHSIKAHLRATL
ncbi:hypothetical protein [Pontibacter actiniarum]|nr:hypothetical protein [Pontibacter actiniarum]